VALTDDQKAMLRLLAQREEGYEDMAALMGLSVEEVRAKVKEALADLAENEQELSPPTPVEKVDSPPGPPVETAPKAEPVEPAAEPESSAPQAPVATAAPPAETPAPPAVAKSPAPKIRPRPTGVSRPQLSLPQDRGARLGLVAGLGAIVVVVILLATGVLGGGDDDSGTSSSTQAGATEAGSRQLTQAILEPTDGSDASGRALFGRAGKQVVLQVEAEGLDPSPQGQSYVIWLARSPRQMLPLAATKVDDSGEIVARYQVPTEVLGFLAGGTFDQIAITLIDDNAFRRSVAQASKQSKSPAVTGSEVLRGDITGPIVGLASREQERG
jgi:hypothetical protein